MSAATALHTRAPCDECGEMPATREGIGGAIFCNTCDGTNDDVLGALLGAIIAAPPLCTRCRARPAFLRIDATLILCAGCLSESDVRLLDSINLNTSPPQDVATTGPLPTAASVVATISGIGDGKRRLGPSLATGMSRDQANAGGEHEEVTPASNGSELCIIENVSGTSPGACSSERDGFGATNSPAMADASCTLAASANGTRPLEDVQIPDRAPQVRETGESPVTNSSSSGGVVSRVAPLETRAARAGVTEIGRTTAEALCRQSESRILPPLRIAGVATGPEETSPVDPGPCGFGPLQFGCPICARIDCDWTHGPHPESSDVAFARPVIIGIDLASGPDICVKYAATSASFAAIDIASADNSKPKTREA